MGFLVAGYATLAIIAGAPNSPLATRLPLGAHPPAWAAALARAAGLDRVPRRVLIALCLLIMAGLVAMFVLLLIEAWAGRVRTRLVLAAAGASLTIAVAAPVLLSRDVFSYAALGRIFALYDSSPYSTAPAAFPQDPFVRVTAAQWLHVHSLYGPVFTLVSGSIARVWARSPNAVILSFKVLAGLGVASATGCVALATRAVRPRRAAWAAAVVGLNPVLVVHTVGGGHNDALIGAAFAGALLCSMTATSRRADTGSSTPSSWRMFGGTALLTIAVLIKFVFVPVLALWIWRLARDAGADRRLGAAAAHIGVVIGGAAAAFAPVWAGRHTFASLATLGGVESWASPSRFLAGLARALTSWMGGSAAAGVARAVVVAWLFAFVAVVWVRSRRKCPFESAADELGPAALLLALAIPYLLPWYAAWFAPALGLIADGGLAWIGVAVTGLLALTLIPADPFLGITTGGVMFGVHDLVAPAMLGLFVVASRRAISGAALRSSSSVGRPPAGPARAHDEGHQARGLE